MTLSPILLPAYAFTLPSRAERQGLIGYLPKEATNVLFRSMFALAAPQSRVVMTALPPLSPAAAKREGAHACRCQSPSAMACDDVSSA